MTLPPGVDLSPPWLRRLRRIVDALPDEQRAAFYEIYGPMAASDARSEFTGLSSSQIKRRLLERIQ